MHSISPRILAAEHSRAVRIILTHRSLTRLSPFGCFGRQISYLRVPQNLTPLAAAPTSPVGFYIRLKICLILLPRSADKLKV